MHKSNAALIYAVINNTNCLEALHGTRSWRRGEYGEEKVSLSTGRKPRAEPRSYQGTHLREAGRAEAEKDGEKGALL